MTEQEGWALENKSLFYLIMETTYTYIGGTFLSTEKNEKENKEKYSVILLLRHHLLNLEVTV